MVYERENTVTVIGGLAGYTSIVSDIKDPKTLPAREAIRQSGIVFFSVLPLERLGYRIIHSTAPQ